ncbi:hypothetical protein [Agromyces sp. NPDC058104]|uniref:hypothetical protein n=1 Tax=Agromyces sp. NPDC058104 TaxID=3346342 RepID=UPI0036DE21E7
MTWYPGLACTFQTSSGELHTAYPGWGATVFAVVAASLIVAGLIARAAPVRLRHHAAAEQEGKR